VAETMTKASTGKDKRFCRLNIDPSSSLPLLSVISVSPREFFFLLFSCGELCKMIYKCLMNIVDHTAKYLNQLIKGKVLMTEDAAMRLERVISGRAGFRRVREARYYYWSTLCAGVIPSEVS
jgi:hypothetical protein